ncbi:unnamed protein product [Callosobruchus maculatus]|uniref:Uncharacterized protein n=1 Tax=Callosobruchus maculatus TaxID=64391 RepID=A0A653BN07_CALMS|nr:unnamed protein product [Callosobruchus maculatus]
MAVFSEKHVSMVRWALLLCLVVDQVMSRPGGEWSQYKDLCSDDPHKREVCQRCAKQTKSPVVYPMCCNEEDEVHHWCIQYTTFGKEY